VSVPPTRFNVRVQEHVADIDPELGWRDVALKAVDKAGIFALESGGASAPVKLFAEPPGTAPADLALWEALVRFPDVPPPGQFRLLIEEYEAISNDKPMHGGDDGAPGRLIFAETVSLDSSLADNR